MAQDRQFQIILRAQNRITRPTRQAMVSVNRFLRSTRFNINLLRVQIRRLNNTMSSMFNVFGRFGAGLGLAGAGGLLFGGADLVKFAAQRDAQLKAISFISGSSSEAAANLKFLKDMSNELAVSYDETLEGFKSFSASIAGSEFEGEKTRDMFKKISTAVRVMGIDSEGTAGIYRAFFQMISKGKIQAEELRKQLSERLPKAQQALVKSMGKEMKDLDGMLKKGSITTTKYLEGFINEIYRTFAGGLPQAVNTAQAKMERLANKWADIKFELGSAIIDSGVLDIIARFLGKLGDWVVLNKELIKTKLVELMERLNQILTFISVNASTLKSIFIGLLETMISLRIAQFALNVAMLLFPGTWIAAILIGLIALIAYLAIKTDGLGMEWAKLKIMIITALDSAKYNLLTFKHTALSVFDSVAYGFGKMVKPIRKFFEGSSFNEGIYDLSQQRLLESKNMNSKLASKYQEFALEKLEYVQKLAQEPSKSRYNADKPFMEALQEKMGLDFSMFTDNIPSVGNASDISGDLTPNVISQILQVNTTNDAGTKTEVSTPDATPINVKEQ